VAVAVVVVVVGTVVGVRAATRGPVRLPPVSANRLAAETAAALAADPTISGTVLVHVDLGIPDLGDTGGLVDAGPLSLLLGDHTIRLWRSPLGARVALVEPSSERDLYLGRDGAWAWDFSTLTATRLAPAGVRTGLFPLSVLTTPRDFEGLLDGLRPTTRVVVDRGIRVAGRPAYPLALEPRTSDTLVGRVEVDVDAARRVPLAVRVFPRGSSRAALDVGFTEVGFGSIDPHTFDFTPPPGSQVRVGSATVGPFALLGALGLGLGGAGGLQLPGVAEVRTFGHDWGTVAALRFRPQESVGLTELTRLMPLSGPLVSARLVDVPGGLWLLVGAVPQSTLQSLSGRLR